MASTIRELRDWLNSIATDDNYDENDLVGVDEGGLTLVVIPKNTTDVEMLRSLWYHAERHAYFEIGGVPRPECVICGNEIDEESAYEQTPNGPIHEREPPKKRSRKKTH